MANDLSDRRRVELLLVVDQLSHFVRTATHAADDEAVLCLDLLARTRAELANGRLEEDRIFPRLVRLDRDHFAPMRKMGQPVAVFGLVLYAFLERLTAADYFVVPDTGPFREALDLLLPALEPTAQEPGRLEDAQIRAVELLHGLRGAGLFRELEG